MRPDKNNIPGVKVAILVDGAFFLQRYKKIMGGHPPKKVANDLYTMCLKHLGAADYLYRIFYYDCRPYEEKAHNPISDRVIDFRETPEWEFRTDFFDELKRKRKVALRLGYLKAVNDWMIRPLRTRELLNNEINIDELGEEDVYLEFRQKGIDIKVGLDIASLAYKQQVQKIILVSGDSDFVPSAKLARREGLDFVLDPMWNHIDSSLFEHIDGLQSTISKPNYHHHNGGFNPSFNAGHGNAPDEGSHDREDEDFNSVYNDLDE